jgi:hypothetical protein
MWLGIVTGGGVPRHGSSHRQFGKRPAAIAWQGHALGLRSLDPQERASEVNAAMIDFFPEL